MPNPKSKAWLEKLIQKREALEKYCVACELPFTASRIDQKFCCGICKRKFNYRKNKDAM